MLLPRLKNLKKKKNEAVITKLFLILYFWPLQLWAVKNGQHPSNAPLSGIIASLNTRLQFSSSSLSDYIASTCPGM